MSRTRALPFENRWTSGEVARHWYLQLEREGLESVKLRHALRDATGGNDPDSAIPEDFIATWLAHRTKQKEKHTFRWRCLFAFLIIVAAIAAITAAWYGLSAYNLAKATQTAPLPRVIGQ